MIAEGEIDALHTARTPSTFATRPEAVKRPLREFTSKSKKRTTARPGSFRSWHTVVIRRELYRAIPLDRQSLYKAFVQAQRRTYEKPGTTMDADHHAPVAGSACRGARRELGRGLVALRPRAQPSRARNFPALHHEQGLSKRRLEAEELFAPETLATFRV